MHADWASCVSYFSDLFVDERTHFYEQVLGGGHFTYQERWLTNNLIEQHLSRRCWIAVVRAEQTRILAVDLDCKNGPDPTGTTFKLYDRIRRLMPEPLVFSSSHTGGLHLYWLLEDEVPTVAATNLLAQYLGEHGIAMGRGTCEILPTTMLSLRLPLGLGSNILHPGSLLRVEAADSPRASIEYLTATLRRHRAHDILDRIAANRRQLSFLERAPVEAEQMAIDVVPSRYQSDPVPASTAVSTRAPIESSSRERNCIGLTATEAAAIWQSTAPLPGLTRFRQMEFLFDVVQTFKTAGQVEMELPKRTIVKMAGAHSGTYQGRIAFAEQAGLLMCTNPVRPRRAPMRFRLLIQAEGPGPYKTLSESLACRDLSFVSSYMRRTVCKAVGKSSI